MQASGVGAHLMRVETQEETKQTYPIETKAQTSKRRSCCCGCIDKIKNFVYQIIFGYVGPAIATVFCYWINPTPFMACLFIGMNWSAEIQNTVNKIKLVWKHLAWQAILIGGMSYFLALPVFLVTCSSICGAYIGSYLYKEALEKEQASAQQRVQTMQV